MHDLLTRPLIRAFMRSSQRLLREDGQTTVEYALVLLGAATLALLLGAWTGGTDKVGDLFDAVFDRVLGLSKD